MKSMSMRRTRADEEATDVVLETANLTIGYGSVPVVRDLNIQVKNGEVVALLGANGAGKTTTLLGLAGELKPMSGSIFFRGRRLTGPLERRARMGIGCVFEERTVLMGLSTKDNLRLGKGGIARAVELMPELTPLLRRRAGLLSGGEQQMLALGRAIAAEPTLLLADELSLGLAPLIITRLMGAVRRAADRGLGVLLVEQHLDQALVVADRAYVLQRGQVVFSGSAGDVRKNLTGIREAYLGNAGREETRGDG
jgi:branched-chain amino acid transport system ATP-binding protein